MKETDIVQALRCCAEGECKDCAMHEDKQRCQENLLDKAAEAIERLTAENAALREKQRWIPVTERLPKLIPSCAGTAYSEAVNVLTTGRKVLTAIYDGTDFITDAEFWDAEGEEITHWTPVLLPLPEPPKEDC